MTPTITRSAVTSISEWLTRRRGYLCASEHGAALGLDPYRSALSVYMEKAGVLVPERTPAMRRGQHFESAALGYFVEDHEDELRVMKAHVFLMDDENRIGATPDALAERKDGTPGLINVQLKTVARSTFEKWNGTPPMSYMLQVACENMLLDASHGILACLVFDQYSAELREFVIERHPAGEERLRAEARQFWKNMEAGAYPPADYRRDADTIKQMFPQATPGEEIDLSADNRLAEILPRFIELKGQAKVVEEEIKAIDNEIRAKVGRAEIATLPGWKITCKNQTRKAYQVAESTSRPLKVTQQESNP